MTVTQEGMTVSVCIMLFKCIPFKAINHLSCDDPLHSTPLGAPVFRGCCFFSFRFLVRAGCHQCHEPHLGPVWFWTMKPTTFPYKSSLLSSLSIAARLCFLLICYRRPQAAIHAYITDYCLTCFSLFL